MTWNHTEGEPEEDYGLQTLPVASKSDDSEPIKFDIDESSISKEEAEELRAFLNDNLDIFSKNDADLGDTDLVTHDIDVGEAEPVKSPPHRLNPDTRAALEDHVNSMLDSGIIEEAAGSPWASPVVLVRKPNGKDYRFCLDMRKVNKVTKKDSYALPRIDDTIDALHGSVYFSSLDLRSAFFQVRLGEESKHLTTFCTHIGSFSFIHMPYGLANATCTFQKLMEKVLRGIQ